MQIGILASRGPLNWNNARICTETLKTDESVLKGLYEATQTRCTTVTSDDEALLATKRCSLTK